MKHLLKMSDLSPDELTHILDVADELKAQQKAGRHRPRCWQGKTRRADVLQRHPPAPAPASRWASTSWGASATT
ncbi:MAG: hypothetical protein ACLVJH_06790 [Faecalibacterium prausnitzii]